jgi:hypothetical protein
MVIETGSGRINKISFEEIHRALSASKSLRASVLRMLASEHGSEFTKHVEVVAKVEKRKTK